MAVQIVTFLLFILPLIVLPIGVSPFETPKVILAEVAIEIMLFVTLIKLKSIKIHLNYPQIIFLGILFILSLDTQLLFAPKGAFFGNAFRLQGQFLFWHLLIFAMLSKSVKSNKLPRYIFYLSFLCLFLATVVLGVKDGRAFGTLGEPNALAATALFIFPFIWFSAKSVVRTLLFILTLTIILLSGSRAGFIGLFLQMLFIALTQVMKISTLKATVFSILIMLASLILPFFQFKGWFENRSQIWQTAFSAGLDSPIIGHGFGNIQKIIHDASVLQNNTIQYQIVDSAHNFLLDFWLQGGLVGVISILMLIFLAFKYFIHHKKLLELTAFLGLLTAMLFNPVSVVNLLAFWWLIGYNHSA